MINRIIDIETIPDENAIRPEFDPSEVKTGNIKDEAKIADKIEQARADFDAGLTKKMSVDSSFCRIVSLGYIDLNGIGEITKEEYIYGEKSDDEILEIFCRLHNRNDRYIGWNIKGFDLPVLWKRGIIKNIPALTEIQKMTHPYRDDLALDLMHLWNNGGYGKLSDCANRLDIFCKTGLDGSKIYQAWKDGRKQDILDYNREDCHATLAIARRLGVL